MVIQNGRVVLTRGADQPYKVVLEYGANVRTEHPVATIREGEELIRRKLPAFSVTEGPEWII